MPESAEEVYARVVATVGAEGRLPLPPVQDWETFPWEVVDGALVPKVLQPPYAEAEPPRAGADGVDCFNCAGDGTAIRVWENDRWKVTHPEKPGGLPLVLWLATKEHLDFPEMDDELAAEFGRLSARLCRIVERLPNIGRVHVSRWGDGSEHLHVWFIARTARLPQILGSMAVEWEEMLPPVPEDIWRADLRTVAGKLANHDGWALAQG
jgi:diadenosine tetraphosphate (Ap4A) HIT family hydrolase